MTDEIEVSSQESEAKCESVLAADSKPPRNDKKRKRLQLETNMEDENDPIESDHELSHFKAMSKRKHQDMIQLAKTFGLQVDDTKDVDGFLQKLESLPITKSGCIKEDYIVDDDESIESSIDISDDDSIDSSSSEDEDDRNSASGDEEQRKKPKKRRSVVNPERERAINEKLQRELALLRDNAKSLLVESDDDDQKDGEIGDGGRARIGKYRLRRTVNKPVTKVDICNIERAPVEAEHHRKRLKSAQKQKERQVRQKLAESFSFSALAAHVLSVDTQD